MTISRLPQCALWTALLTTFATAQHTSYVFEGSTPFGRFGSALTFLSDLDGDGSEELAVGSPGFTNNMGVVVGRVEVLNRNGAVLWGVNGSSFNEQFGWDLDRVPDVDGDGFDELLVGAWSNAAAGTHSGRACLLSGATGVELWSVPGPQPLARFGFAVAFAGATGGAGTSTVIVGAPGINGNMGAAYLLDAVSGTVMLTLNGQHPGESFGYSVGGAGLINLDPVEDVMVGAPFRNGNGSQSGALYFIHGQQGGFLSTLQGLAGSLLGFSAAAFDDISGDGRDDFIVGAPGFSPSGSNSAGAAFLRASFTGGAPPVTSFPGTQPGETFGFRVARGGDRNGDGQAEVICSSPGWTGPLGWHQGRAMVYRQDGQPLFTAFGNTGGEEFGAAIRGDGDFNGDGRADLAVGAPRFGAGGLIDAGRVLVYPADGIVGYGSNAGGLNTLGLDTAGSPMNGNLVVFRVRNGHPGGVSTFGVALDRDFLQITRPDGVITLLLDRNLILPWAIRTLDQDGAAEVGAIVEPWMPAAFGGVSLFLQANAVLPNGEGLRASNGLQVTFGY